MTEDPLVALAQLGFAFLSVPIIASALSALLRFMLPSARLASRLSRDLAIYENAPDSPEKKEFRTIIASTLGQLNARYAPSLVTRRIQIWKGFAYVTASVVGLVGAAFFIAVGFAMNPALAGTATITAALAGAAITTVVVVLIQITKTREVIETSVRVDSASRARVAESLVLSLVRRLGIADAREEHANFGADIVSEQYVIDVKSFSEQSVPAVAVRQLLSFAALQSKRALLFSTTGFTPDAMELADTNGVALFRFSLDDEKVEGLNALGLKVIENGVEKAFAGE